MTTLADLVKDAVPVTLEEMLDAREARVRRQRDLLARHGGALVSFTLNIPGEYKAYPLARDAFAEGMTAMAGQLRRAKLRVPECREHASSAGYEGYFAVDAEPGRVKTLTLIVENGHALGRLFDFDVLGRDGIPLRGVDAGRGERSCFICGKPVWECARSRAHPVAELSLKAAELFKEFFDARHADWVASCATRALLYEVNTTPKPGLVDCANTGSHADMDLFTFIDSSVVLTPYFRQSASIGMHFAGEASAMLPWLRFPGQTAEESMFAATSGVNTHKGLIFSLGIFCAALGFLRARDIPRTLENVLRVCGEIAANTPEELERPKETGGQTHGEAVHSRYGLTGVRGEAAQGYPHVREHGFPAFRAMRESGSSINDSGVVALLHLLAHVPDTNMVSRSDLATLHAVQDELRSFLHGGKNAAQIVDYAASLDQRFIAENLSPGGCADLLALVYFLSFVL